MCRSKEAREHFIFVPCAPPRSVARGVRHRAFLEVCVQPSSLAPARAARADPAAAGAAPSARSLGAAAAAGAVWAAGAATLVGGIPGAAAGASMIKVAMMPPPPMATQPASRNGEENSQDTAVARREGGFMDTLFPGFSADTFIWRISVLQLVEYAGSVLLGNSYGVPKLCSLYLLGASWGPAIAAGAVWRLFMPMMLHANPLHIFFNIFFQLRIGCNMEKQFGRRKFCLLYLFCGFMGNLLSVVADPMKLAVGASTSGFGLLGVWAAEVMLTWELLGESQGRVFLWFAFMLGSCVMMSAISPSVDFMGHFGGALAGFLLAIMLADMQEEHRPEWYGKAKTSAKNATALIIGLSLLKAITFGPDGPIPHCGSILSPLQLPF